MLSTIEVLARNEHEHRKLSRNRDGILSAYHRRSANIAARQLRLLTNTLIAERTAQLAAQDAHNDDCHVCDDDCRSFGCSARFDDDAP